MTDRKGTRLLTQLEVAAILRKSVKTVIRLRNEGELTFIPGRPVLISELELERYIRRNSVRKELRARELHAAKYVRKLTPREQARKMVAELRAKGINIPKIPTK